MIFIKNIYHNPLIITEIKCNYSNIIKYQNLGKINPDSKVKLLSIRFKFTLNELRTLNL